LDTLPPGKRGGKEKKKRPPEMTKLGEIAQRAGLVTLPEGKEGPTSTLPARGKKRELMESEFLPERGEKTRHPERASNIRFL